MEGGLPVARVDPVDENLKRLVDGEDLARAEVGEVGPDRKARGADAGRLRFIQAFVLRHDYQ